MNTCSMADVQSMLDIEIDLELESGLEIKNDSFNSGRKCIKHG